MISKVGNTRDYTKPSEAEDRGLRAHCVDFAGGYSLRMLRKYYGLKPPKAVNRICLKCDREFLSEHIGHRLCGRCPISW